MTKTLDWNPCPEDVGSHTMMFGLPPHEDGRQCMFHARLNMHVFTEQASETGWGECLRQHPIAAWGADDGTATVPASLDAAPTPVTEAGARREDECLCNCLVTSHSPDGRCRTCDECWGLTRKDPTPAAPVPRDAGDTEALGQAVYEASAPRQLNGRIQPWVEIPWARQEPHRKTATRLLASDWLATRDAALRADAWAEGAKAGQYNGRGGGLLLTFLKTNPHRIAAGGAL